MTPAQTVQPLRILIVEDDTVASQLVARVLLSNESLQAVVDTSLCLSDAMSMMAKSDYDALLLDLSLSDSTGLETVRQVRDKFPRIPIIVLSGNDNEDVAVDAVLHGAQDYIVKGSWTPDILVRSIRYAIERHASRVALGTLNDRLSAILESIRDGFLSLDHQMRVTYLNSGAEKILGKRAEEILGTVLSDFWPVGMDSDRLQALSNALSEHRSVTFETQGCFRSPDQWYEIRLYPLADGVSVFIQNTTSHRHAQQEQKRLETQLQQAQRMEALAVLAGGIAGDFNNIIASALILTEQAINEARKGAPVESHLTRVIDELRRATAVVKQIVLFDARIESSFRTYNPAEMVRAVIEELKPSMRTTIRVRESIAPSVPDINGDREQVSQALRHLLTNAAQALDTCGNTIDITVETATIPGAVPGAMNELTAGTYARIIVADNGPGIDPAIIDRVFEPFFTTRPTGEGSGMGLAIVHGVARGQRGTVCVETTPGKGSRFSLYLPLSAAATESDIPDQSSASPQSASRALRILFVDDESVLVDVASETLKDSGHTVRGFVNPEQALETFRASPSEFDLLVTDFSMPRLNGLDLTRQCLTLRPELRVLLCSGYLGGDSEVKARAAGVSSVLPKPYDYEDLLEAVRSAMK